MDEAARFVVILAGGASARFWPRIGDEFPKFLLRMADGRSLLQMAFARACTLAPLANVLVVCGAAQAETVTRELGLAKANVIVEPSRRDTLAACALGSAVALERHPNALVVTMPADSLMQPEQAMAKPLNEAIQLGAFEGGRLFCFGITPLRPETGFGYLQLGKALGDDVALAQRFIEKPDLPTAESFLYQGGYVWNAGAFAWLARDFLNEVERQHSGAAQAATDCARHLGEDPPKATVDYVRIPAKSVDFGVMEGAKNVGVLRVQAEFDDVGTWDALDRLGALPASKTALSVASKGCNAVGESQVAFAGCRDLVVVVEGSRVLVMQKGHGHDVKAITRAWQEQQSCQ